MAEALLEIGHIVKPHGLKGEVVVSLTTDRTERLEAGTVLATDHGPLTVNVARPHQNRWLVTFAEIGDRNRAEDFRRCTLRAEPLDDPETLWVHELIGATVVDTTGKVLGSVDEVQANPAHDLLVLDGGGLVPVVFVVGTEDGRVVVDPPSGLLDL